MPQLRHPWAKGNNEPRRGGHNRELLGPDGQSVGLIECNDGDETDIDFIIDACNYYEANQTDRNEPESP